LSAGGRNFIFTHNLTPLRFSDPLVAEIAAFRDRDYTGHFAVGVRDSIGAQPRLARLAAVVDETGMPVLYTSGENFAFTAAARITFPDRRWLRFLVRGTRKANAIMTAVDQAGNGVIRFRRRDTWGQGTDVVVHPDRTLTDELALTIALSAHWLSRFFRTG
jgi:hypothetical protein